MEDFQTLRARHIEAVRTFTPEAIARLSWSRKQVREEQVRGLRRVLAHGQRHSPFHARRRTSMRKLFSEDLEALAGAAKALGALVN